MRRERSNPFFTAPCLAGLAHLVYPRPRPAAVPSLCPEEGLHLAFPGPHTVLLGWLHTAISPSVPPPLRDTIPALPQFGQSFNKQIASYFFSAYKITHAHYRNMRNRENSLKEKALIILQPSLWDCPSHTRTQHTRIQTS